jgi:hypothetical protein
MAMMRYARSALAIVFAMLGVAFVALWVRSYWSHDEITGPVGDSDLCLSSDRGVLLLGILPYDLRLGWELRHYAADGIRNYSCGLGVRFLRQGGWGPSGILFAHWFLALSSLSLAALLAFKRTWRFSLRSVLVATTILAGLLGLAVYLV